MYEVWLVVELIRVNACVCVAPSTEQVYKHVELFLKEADVSIGW